ncbi:MAG TPA: ATP-binding protein [Bacteroidales bacterium]|nr:ATP-binding protein [Bacteroidales bacterium]HPT02977.1 ATP-binding protein [Bacteroidales bacterium]
MFLVSSHNLFLTSQTGNEPWLLARLILAAAMVLAACLIFMYFRQRRKLKGILRENSLLVDEMERLKEEIHIVRQQAGESDRLKSAFLCNMSHEIRTPLNAIMGFCGLIANHTLPDTDKVQYASIINRNVDSLLELINDIFDIAQVESQITRVEEKPVKINDMLGSLQSWFNLEKSTLGKEMVQFRIEKANKDNDFAIQSDEYMLRRTLNNLIENALKYSEEGYVDVGYRFGRDSKIDFFVKDEGIGFSKDKLDIIFKQFRQVDETQTRQYGGLGLGLTVAQKFVELMGGEMWAESELGKGSTFWFSIPYKKA